MTVVSTGTAYLKDFGQGDTDDATKAHEFTPDEAAALAALYNYDAIALVGGLAEPALLIRRPSIPAGPDMVWVQYRDIWFAAERQALFIGTRKALWAEADRVCKEIIGEENTPA